MWFDNFPEYKTHEGLNAHSWNIVLKNVEIILNQLYTMKNRYLQQCGTQEIIRQVKWATTNHNKCLSLAKEGNAIYDRIKSPWLWAPFIEPNDWLIDLYN